MLPMTKSALSRGFCGDALFAGARLEAVPSCLLTATAPQTVLRRIARAERAFVNMASVRVVARTMSVKIAAIYQPEGCRVSVPASAVCARSPHLALVFAIPDSFDKADS